MPIGSVELIGHLFADVFRRADGVRVATMAERVWRRGGGGGQSWISFPSFGGAPLFIDDPVQAWADAAAWFAHRTLIVPAHETLEIAELAPAPTMPLPYDENSGLSIASGEPPEFAVHGLREEVVRRDGAIEALIVHLTVESEVAGKYQITAQFEGRAPIIEEHALPFGRQELTFGYDRQDFATAPGPLRLISVRTQFAARRKGVEARTTSTSLETGAYPRNLWSALPSRPFRLLSNGAVVRRTGTNFEVDLTIFALHSCDGGLDSVLSFSMGYLIGGVKLHPGYNRVTLHTQPLKIQQLHGPPHTIAFSEVRCGEHTFDLTEALTLPTLDFRGIPGARCSADYNGDGRVDDADLPLAIAEAHQQFTVLARTRTYEWVTEEGMRRNAEYYNQQNRGCRTK